MAFGATRSEDRTGLVHAAAHARTGREQFAAMEVLRIVASLMIVLFHAHSIARNNARAVAAPFFDAPIFWYSAIDLFFVMSGFLMIHMGRNLFGRPDGLRVFAVRRAIRTPPLYWVYTTLIALIFVVRPSLSSTGPVTWDHYLASMLFVPIDRQPVITIGWTLNYEMFFYVIIGLSVLLPFERAWKFAVAALVAIVAFGQVVTPVGPFRAWTDPLILDFAIGIGVAALFYRGWSLSRLGRVLVLVLGLALIASLHRLADRDLLRTVTMGLGMGCVVAAATLRDDRFALGRWTPAVTLLSSQAYTLYLSHILVLKVVEMVFFRLFAGTAASVAYIILGTLASVAVSTVLFFLIEKPLSEGLRRFVKRRQLI